MSEPSQSRSPAEAGPDHDEDRHGESTRFLRHNRNILARVLTRQSKPDRLLRDLAPVVTDTGANVPGFHLYTFNEVAGRSGGVVGRLTV